MSLRDDLETLIQAAAWTPPPSDDEILGACSRLRAALTPAAEKWLEALPELLEMRLKVDSIQEDEEFGDACVAALHEAAALHNAQDNKEQK